MPVLAQIVFSFAASQPVHLPLPQDLEKAATEAVAAKHIDIYRVQTGIRGMAGDSLTFKLGHKDPASVSPQTYSEIFNLVEKATGCKFIRMHQFTAPLIEEEIMASPAISYKPYIMGEFKCEGIKL